MAFNYEVMEEELTCPVCLELYADPLILPCSHSMCKKCLEDIFDSRAMSLSRNSSAGRFECPSCREVSELTKDKISTLPKNLALENIVSRFSEERRKSMRQSLVVDLSAVFDLMANTDSQGSGAAASAGVRKTTCDLCEGSATLRASADWCCEQCDVLYCQACFVKYHPRRGALARHHVKSSSFGRTHTPGEKSGGRVSMGSSCPPGISFDDKPAYCVDHEREVPSMFCDRCKVYVCHLCVCDGEGRHGGHKMLAPDTACTLVKEMASKTKEQSDSLLACLLDDQSKIDDYHSQVNILHKSSCARVEQQYARFIEDLTHALNQEKQAVIRHMDETRQKVVRQTDSYRAESSRCGRTLSELSRSCHGVSVETGTVAILKRASELQPLVVRIKKHRKEVGMLHRRYESILKDKSFKLQMLSSAEQFRKRIDKVLSWFHDDAISGSDSIIPNILSPPLASTTSALIPRAQNKYLTTWGFRSTTFSGEALSRPCSWTMTVERNSSSSLTHGGGVGYLFGIGIAAEAMASKEVVGMTTTSHGLVASGGSLSFAHAGSHDTLTAFDGLPISVTVAVRREPPDVTVFTYKLSSASTVEGARRVSLVGRRVVHDVTLACGDMYPVFTVSQRVKILFPTYV